MMYFSVPRVLRVETSKRMCFSGKMVQLIKNSHINKYFFYNMVSDISTTDSLSPTGDPCPQPQPITASMLYPCTNATSMSYFDSGSKAGFGIFIIALFFFPVGQYDGKFTFKSEILSFHQWFKIYIFFFFSLKLTQWVSSWLAWWPTSEHTGTKGFWKGPKTTPKTKPPVMESEVVVSQPTFFTDWSCVIKKVLSFLCSLCI